MTAATATKPVTFTSKELGKVTLVSYVDAFEGKTNSDLTTTDCGRCGGTGYTCFVWVHNGVCFECGGNGRKNITVGTMRRRAKQEAYRVDFAAEIAAHREAERVAAEAAAKIAEFEADWDAAHAEAAKRDAMVQGFLGVVGEKLTGLVGEVQVAKYISGSYNRSSAMFLVIKLDSGQVVKTFGSSTTLFGLNRGDAVTLSGKVKAHETYAGQDQTVISHAKAVVAEEVAAA
jgi:hypothetical protein